MRLYCSASDRFEYCLKKPGCKHGWGNRNFSPFPKSSVRYFYCCVFSIRQCAACASTLITHKHSQEEEIQGKPTHRSSTSADTSYNQQRCTARRTKHVWRIAAMMTTHLPDLEKTAVARLYRWPVVLSRRRHARMPRQVGAHATTGMRHFFWEALLSNV